MSDKTLVHEVLHADSTTEEITPEIRSEASLLKAGALQSAIFNSANFSSIATDAKGVIQIFNVGAEWMLGYTAAEVMNKITPADISEPQEVIARAEELSLEFRTPITPGFEALVFKASRGIEDIYELTYIRKDGSRFPAVVSVTALRDEQNAIIGYLLIGTDNTARKEAEEQKKKLREELETIIDHIPGPVFYKDTENRFVRVNKFLAEAMGLNKSEMEGKDCFELYPREDANSYWEDDLEVINSGVSKLDINEPYETASGPGWLITSKVPFLDGSGKCIGIIGVSLDNTARKQAEEALFKAAPLQSAIFNSANFSIIATDAKGVIQIFNVGAERMLGYMAAEVMNKITPADISDPQEVIIRAEALSLELGTPIAPGFEALVFKASRGIEDIYELTYIRKDGSRFPAVVSVTALRDEQEAIIGYLLIGTDNTARKLIEAEQVQLSQRLRDHQFYTRSLFECNIDAIMTTDPSGIITDVNKQMEVLSSCTRDELIGAPFKNYFIDPVRAETSIKLVLKEKKVTDFELTARARDGKETVVSINATTFYDRDRRLQGVFAAARDVTERKRLDQVLQEKNIELESARSVAEKTNLAKSDFLANMSHELRTPLNSVIGFSEVLQDQVFGPINEKQQEYVSNILTSGRHLLSLINDILDLSKVESGKMKLELSTFSLRETVDASLMMLMEKALKNGLYIHIDIAPQADVQIVADQRKLKQILFNLLSNAVKFTPKGGTVEVSAARDTDLIKITVADTGVGISEEDIPKLFQTFTQLESVYTKEFEGTGLGLALNKQLVELHGGRIWVESQSGVGSKFMFTIPLTQADTIENLSNIPE
jgi:PAS domain S-box-containing protein